MGSHVQLPFLRAIAAVEGVDVLLIGCSDLTLVSVNSLAGSALFSDKALEWAGHGHSSAVGPSRARLGYQARMRCRQEEREAHWLGSVGSSPRSLGKVLWLRRTVSIFSITLWVRQADEVCGTLWHSFIMGAADMGLILLGATKAAASLEELNTKVTASRT